MLVTLVFCTGVCDCNDPAGHWRGRFQSDSRPAAFRSVSSVLAVQILTQVLERCKRFTRGLIQIEAVVTADV